MLRPHRAVLLAAALLAVAGVLLPARGDAQLPASALTLVAVTPCRAVDTRGNGFVGPFGTPSLPAGVPRDFPLAGQCGIPADAAAVSLNVTAVNPLGPGFLLLAPAGSPPPLVSTLNYDAGETVANAAVAPLGPGGLTVIAGVSGTDLILDVNGYYSVCPPSMVRSGATCLDKYEASVWETTDPALIAKIRAGTVTLAELQAAGAVQRGTATSDYGSDCPTDFPVCANLYAVSVPGVTPSRFLSWVQASAIARNTGRRLPTNAEWQAAALRTPELPPCVVSLAGPGLTAPGVTGTAGCVSTVGAFDMVGNVDEWVADLGPQTVLCPNPDLFGPTDFDCTTINPIVFPNQFGALVRGGSYDFRSFASVFGAFGYLTPIRADATFGFRGAR
jgi:hypothetical protein